MKEGYSRIFDWVLIDFKLIPLFDKLFGYMVEEIMGHIKG